MASVEGLSQGEKVVSAPTENMQEGMKINPLEETSQQGGNAGM